MGIMGQNEFLISRAHERYVFGHLVFQTF